jgi:hypothetical protein
MRENLKSQYIKLGFHYRFSKDKIQYILYTLVFVLPFSAKNREQSIVQQFTYYSFAQIMDYIASNDRTIVKMY